MDKCSKCGLAVPSIHAEPYGPCRDCGAIHHHMESAVYCDYVQGKRTPAMTDEVRDRMVRRWETAQEAT